MSITRSIIHLIGINTRFKLVVDTNKYHIYVTKRTTPKQDIIATVYNREVGIFIIDALMKAQAASVHNYQQVYKEGCDRGC